MAKGKLTFFCGKMGAGKTTRATDIALETNAVLLSEDEWLESLYPGRIATLADYIKYSGQLRPQIKRLVQAVLRAGADVVMDFPANTTSQRAWFRSIYSELEAPHALVYIELSNDDCMKQIEHRRTQRAERHTTDTREMFEAVTTYFVAPQPEEGFNVVTIRPPGPSGTV
jgi:predicted kinase